MSETLSYAAGLFDGEGSAGVYLFSRRGKSGSRKNIVYRVAVPILQLRMTDPEPVAFMYELFGGWHGTSKPSGRTLAGEEKKLVYEWRTSHRVALAAAKRLLPFIKNGSKIRQLDLIVKHYESFTRPVRGSVRPWNLKLAKGA